MLNHLPQQLGFGSVATGRFPCWLPTLASAQTPVDLQFLGMPGRYSAAQPAGS